MAVITWENVEKAVKEAKQDYENVEKNLYKGIALFGAGEFGQLILPYLLQNGYKINAFLDNSPKKTGQNIQGIKIATPNNFSEGVVLITARRAIGEIKAYLSPSVGGGGGDDVI